MRMRFKPYARAELMASDFHIHEPLTHAGGCLPEGRRAERTWLIPAL